MCHTGTRIHFPTTVLSYHSFGNRIVSERTDPDNHTGSGSVPLNVRNSRTSVVRNSIFW